MNRIVLLAAIVILPILSMAQNTDNNTAETKDSIFIVISSDNIFSRCFTHCDLNEDGKVSFAEAKKTTKLNLNYGGRKNIISDYSFLKYFPNLIELSIGNTPNESIDLSKNTKLEIIDLRGGLWIKEVTIVRGCNPKIFFPIHDQPITFKQVPDPNSIW